ATSESETFCAALAFSIGSPRRSTPSGFCSACGAAALLAGSGFGASFGAPVLQATRASGSASQEKRVMGDLLPPPAGPAKSLRPRSAFLRQIGPVFASARDVDADVLVLGAGVAGLSAAREL